MKTNVVISRHQFYQPFLRSRINKHRKSYWTVKPAVCTGIELKQLRRMLHIPKWRRARTWPYVDCALISFKKTLVTHYECPFASCPNQKTI